MPRCPTCRRLLSVHDDDCPYCRTAPAHSGGAGSGRSGPDAATCNPGTRAEPPDVELPADDDVAADFVPLARFQHSAEAGYFADELSRCAGIDADVQMREQFDALHASWSVAYLLSVPRVQAADAAAVLQELIEQTADVAETDPGLPDDPAAAEGALTVRSVALWAPVLLTLTAGSLAYWGIERADPAPRRVPALVDPDPRPPFDLWDVLTEAEGPWVQQIERRPGQRRLHVDPRRQVIVVEEDRDGDGRYERRWEFDRLP